MSIGSFAFCDCRSLSSVRFGDSVIIIGNYAFSGCRSLTQIELPNGVTTIGSRAFSVCPMLRSLTIPNSVTYIGDDAVSGSLQLKAVRYNGTKEQWSSIQKGSNCMITNGSYGPDIHCTDGTISK